MSRSRNNRRPPLGMGHPTFNVDEYVQGLVENELMSRANLFTKFFDPRRNMDEECGYIGTMELSAEVYKELWNRDPIMQRICQLYPRETWEVQPNVYEDEDPEVHTDFEEALEHISDSLRNTSWHKDDEGEGNIVWEYCRRGDELSGIGTFGVLLLGIDDGLPLHAPAEGAVSFEPTTNRVGTLVQQGGRQKMVHNASLGNQYTGDGPVMDPVSKGVFAHDVSIPMMSPVERQRLQLLKDGKTKQIITNSKGDVVREVPLADEDGNNAMTFNFSAGSILGTDAQYVGVQFGPSEYPSNKPSGKPKKLVFIRCFDESLVQIVQYEANVNNPRFGQPVMYRITLNDPRQQHSGVGLPLATMQVHWSRVIHLADNLCSSEIFGIPRAQPHWNRLMDLRKLYGGSAEMYWKGAFPTRVISTHPQLGGDVTLDKKSIDEAMWNIDNTLQRHLTLTGAGLSQLSPAIADPSGQVSMHLQAICIQLACPMRVFMGSERGELASSQDDEAWNDRKRARQINHNVPRIIVPLIDRLIIVGVLPVPEQYTVSIPPVDALGEKDKAGIALTLTQAMQAFVAGNVESICPLPHWFSNIVQMPEERVKQIIADATKEKANPKDRMTPVPPAGGMPTMPPPGAPKTGPQDIAQTQPPPPPMQQQKQPFGGKPGGKPFGKKPATNVASIAGEPNDLPGEEGVPIKGEPLMQDQQHKTKPNTETGD